MNVRMVLLWLQATGLTLEWTSAAGRTFQFAGRQGMVGFWERFHAGSHPTRRRLSDSEAAEHFAAADSFALYRLYSLYKLWDEGETISREQLFGKIEELFPGAKGGAK